MDYGTPTRTRHFDWFSTKYFYSNRTAYDEIIHNAEHHLLTQNGLFDAEGGYLGLLTQLAVMAGGFAALVYYRPGIYKCLMNGNLKFCQWGAIGASSFLTYRLGYWAGYSLFGEGKKVNNHFAAYHWQKTQNRFDGRINLVKAPMSF